ncbi:MAG TPA: shikimate dehydrogenase [Mycobacteriales bacterium]|nr:shikimate dehydrogenase [Mycobacteriales bacterium]
MSRRGGAALGSPIAHSLSPVLHQAAYDALGLSEWSFRTVECTEDMLAATLRSLDEEGLAGVALTMPLKRRVVPLLAASDGRVQATAAANTVVFADGGWRGGNTDVPGIVAVLRSQGVDSASVARPVILGAGATAGSALAALAELGFTTSVVLARRPAATLEVVAVADRVGIAVEVGPWAAAAEVAGERLVISTTPAGATDPLAIGLPATRGLLVDVVYAPWPTAFAAAWADAGGRAVGGLELLVEQAVEQVRLLTGQAPPAEVLRTAGYAALREREIG